MKRRCAQVLERMQVNINLDMLVCDLNAAQKQLVEIAKAVSYNSKIIVFDEPTSSLTETEVEHLFKIINMLRDKGCGIIYISHKWKKFFASAMR